MLPDKHNILVLIPARAGSKGVPNKNVRPFNGGVSLVERTIDIALSYFDPENIVVSSDSAEALSQARNRKVNAHIRPAELASDTAGMQEVMLDAIQQYGTDKTYLLLLQPTSPFRKPIHIQEAISIFQEADDAVVAMHDAKAHPMYTLFQLKDGYVGKYEATQAVRRQDLPRLLEVNGLLYLLSIEALQNNVWTAFDHVRPLITDNLDAIDIDTPQDWWLAEVIERALVSDSI
jgi:CMP-N,N'-diacetyllegionaminic acid synthase